MALLIVRDPGRVAFTHELRGTCTIGRDGENDIVLTDRQASRKHLRLDAAGDGHTLTDLNSTHGTLVNGKVVNTCKLRDGDLVHVGNARFAYHARAATAEAIDRSVTAASGPPAHRDDADARRLHLLYDVGRAFASLADADELVGRLLGSALELLGCERGLVGLSDGHRGPGRRIARTRGGDPRAAEEMVVSREALDAMRVRHEGILVRDPAGGARSAMGAPLQVAGTVLGFIYVDDQRRADRFTPRDLDFLIALSQLMAAALEQARRQRRLSSVAEALLEAHPPGELLGTSEAMQRLAARIRRFAPSTDTSVLILGESGTGKELVARTVHALSPRADEAFVAVNCAAIPDSLIESELFGHERGAFTGAIKSRRGKFALAHGGTLFLDEIGDLSLSAQAKVLRAIEEGEVAPVGSEEPVKVDVRFVSATHKRLEDEVGAGRFRGDLYYRLNVAEIAVPPLRERGDDVLLLARCFLARAAARAGRPGSAFTDDAVDALRRYRWPGNVRQLQNEVERAVLLSDGPDVDLEDLRLRVAAAADELAASPPDGEAPLPTIEDAQRELLELTLRELGGNIRATARALGITRATLYRKIKRYGLKAGPE